MEDTTKCSESAIWQVPFYNYLLGSVDLEVQPVDGVRGMLRTIKQQLLAMMVMPKLTSFDFDSQNIANM